MSQKIAALVMMFGGYGTALAQTAAEPVQTPAEVDAEIENDIATAEVPNGRFSAEFGFGLRKGPGPELRLNWYHDDDQVFGLRVGQYTAKDISHFDEVSLLSVGLQTRYSLEGSFYVQGALDITHIKTTIDEAEKTSNAGNGTYGFEGTVNQNYFQLSVGNQWQSGQWTYGADWLNLYVPITGSKFKTSSSGDISDRESRERQDRRDLKTEAWDISYGFSLHGGIIF